MKAAVIAFTMMLAGCSGTDAKDEAAAMKMFIESCNAPVQGTLRLSTFGNEVELHCSEFKPLISKGKP